MGDAAPLYRYANFTVWPNRVEYAVGWWIFKKVTILPMKKISSVEASGMTNKLVITMDDGKTHTYHVMQVQKARDAILGAL